MAYTRRQDVRSLQSASVTPRTPVGLLTSDPSRRPAIDSRMSSRRGNLRSSGSIPPAADGRIAHDGPTRARCEREARDDKTEHGTAEDLSATDGRCRSRSTPPRHRCPDRGPPARGGAPRPALVTPLLKRSIQIHPPGTHLAAASRSVRVTPTLLQSVPRSTSSKWIEPLRRLSHRARLAEL